MSFLEIKKVKIEVEVALDMLEEQLLRTVNPNVQYFSFTFFYHFFFKRLYLFFCFVQMDSDLQYKAEIERLRNKQRQREQLFSAQPFTLAASTNSRNSNRAWKHQQHKIDAVLDPVTSMDESGKYVPAEEYLVPCQTPMMKCFAKIGNS